MQKVVIITGASSGIGYATARLLAQSGCTVYALARRLEKMQPLKQYGVYPIAADVTDQQQLESAIDTVLQHSGRIDVLFNNAGYGSFGAIEDVPIAEAQSQFDVNLFGLARITKLVLPQMRKQHSGLIINTSSMGGKMYSPLGGWYHATKYALEGFSDCLRYEVQPFGIRVCIIEPGNIDSAWNPIMLQNVRRQSGKGAYFKQVDQLDHLMHHIGKYSPPQVIAKTVRRAVFAKNPKTRYLVGKNAKLFVFARAALPDRLYDRALRLLSRGKQPVD